MHIGLDVRMWAESGIGRYIRNVVHSLLRIDNENSYTLFGLSKDAEIILSIISEHSDRWQFVAADYRWYSFDEQVFFLQTLNSAHVDVMHFPHFNVPFLYSQPYIVTIHDLTHFTFSMERASTLSPLLYRVKFFVYQSVFRRAIEKSIHVITISEYVKRELKRTFGISEDKMSVLYEAVDPHFKDIVPQAVAGVNVPYFFYVGNAHPHKNLEFLLLSFSNFLKKHPTYFLVLAGKRNYFWERLIGYAHDNTLDTHVHFLDFVSDEELAYLYSHAVAYVFPSLSEGFGLPLLEAMQLGCPVVSSSATCLPEIGGDAVLYFDPHSEDDCVKKLESVAFDPLVRSSLISRGAERVLDYQWDDHARGLVAKYTNSAT